MNISSSLKKLLARAGAILFLSSSTLAQGQGALSGSVSDAATKNHQRLLKELASGFDGTFRIDMFPNQRGVSYVSRGLIDFHYPVLLPLSNVKRKFEYDFSSLTVSTIVYAVFVRKDNRGIFVYNLQDYLIEGESGHVDFFDFKVTPSTCVECSFKKLEHGRIDGYIYPAVEGDQVISALKLKNIESRYFDTYEIKFALPKNRRGKEIDSLLTNLFRKSNHQKGFRNIFKDLKKKNKDWVPDRKY